MALVLFKTKCFYFDSISLPIVDLSILRFLKPYKKVTYSSACIQDVAINQCRQFCIAFIKNVRSKISYSKFVSMFNAVKNLYYNNGSLNIRYHGKQMTSLKDLLLWLTYFDICRGRTVARKCKFDFVLQLGICLSIPLNMEIDTVRLLMSRACMSNVTDTS